MSQLKKQSVAGRKNPRRPRPASTKNKSSGVSLGTLGSVCLRAGTHVMNLVIRPCLTAAKRWPRAALILGITGLSVALAGYGANRVMRSVTQSLPENIEISSPRQDLFESITKISNDTLATAKSEQWSRSALTDKLLSRISLVDGVDEVSIRAGLNKRLKIEIAAQAPLLVIEAKGSERVLVGSKFKIISRGLNQHEYENLPVLEAPDLALHTPMSKEKRKAQTGLFVRASSVSSANVRWLSQQTLRIHSLLNASKISGELEKIIWKNGTGFSIILKNPNQPVNSNIPTQTVMAQPLHASESSSAVAQVAAVQHTTVILGEGLLTEKFERLSQIMQDVRLKKAHVEQIDLAFSDKAVIRMSESMSEVKRGGLQ